MTNTIPSASLQWPPLIPGTLIKRYKRFLADVVLADQRVVTAHCPNSGSMKTCAEPGSPVFLSYHDNPKRKLKYTWELIRMPSSLVGVNTLVPNRLVHHSILSEKIEALNGYQHVKREVPAGKGSRIDLLLSNNGSGACYVEVKNCTLIEGETIYFPDAVTARGLKHLVELQKLVRSGFRCVMFFLVQRMDGRVFKPADHIDPDYGKGLRKAVKNGVEMLVYDVKIDLKQIRIRNQLPYIL